eukprot:3260223-Pleurochrysis_carterae.AAC.1
MRLHVLEHSAGCVRVRLRLLLRLLLRVSVHGLLRVPLRDRASPRACVLSVSQATWGGERRCKARNAPHCRSPPAPSPPPAALA